MDRSGTRCAPPCGIGIRTRCRSCSRCRSSVAWIGIWHGSRRRWWVIRKREPRWQSAADRARVAAELIEEAASLTEESTIASPADVARAGLPPPISAQLPVPSTPPGGEAGPGAETPKAAPTLDDVLAGDPENVALLIERAGRLAAAAPYRAAPLHYQRAPRDRPAHGRALDDLALRSADAIVRPSTTRLDPTTPAVRRLETVGGPEFASHLRLQKELPVGAAVVTAGGGDLPAEFVIHAVIRSDTEPVTRDGVARAWRSTLQQIQEWEFGTVAVPPIGTGAGNLTVEDAAEIMVPILKAHLGGAVFPAEVCFVVEMPAERDAFEAVLRRSEAAQS